MGNQTDFLGRNKPMPYPLSGGTLLLLLTVSLLQWAIFCLANILLKIFFYKGKKEKENSSLSNQVHNYPFNRIALKSFARSCSTSKPKSRMTGVLIIKHPTVLKLCSTILRIFHDPSQGHTVTKLSLG